MSGLFQDEPDLPDPPQDGPGLFGDAAPVAPPPPVATVQYRVLARKYRPVRFDQLIGQEAMVRTLRNAFASGRVAHAFMLTGVRGVGKTTTARIIARALNCVGPDGNGGPTVDPCGVCDMCRAILADRHPDVVEMDAASNNSIDDIREIIEGVRFRPMQARTKVFVLDEVHMLSKPAFNALLKTLEEPPPHVKFIFATTEIRKVPVTVLSRCQRFDLRRISVVELAGLFASVTAQENVAIAPEALTLIARAADGSARDGLSLLDQAIAQTDPGVEIAAPAVADMLGLADREAMYDLFEAVMGGKPAAALAITDRAHAHGADMGVMLQDMLELVHLLTRLKSVPGLRDGLDLSEVERVRGAALADRLSIPVLGRAWQMLLKGCAEVESAPDRRAAAEMVLIRLCHTADLPPPGDLVRRLMDASAAAPSAPLPQGGGGGGTRAVANGTHLGANGGAVAHAVAQSGPVLSSFRDVVALVADQREALLHGHLRHSVHLVRFSQGVIELRAEPDAPRDLAPKLAALLSDATGTRWTIAFSEQQGDPTLAEQAEGLEAGRRHTATQHPLVQAILAAFPGAKIGGVHDPRLDHYGLMPEPAAVDMPEFAPDDAEYVDEPPDDWDN